MNGVIYKYTSPSGKSYIGKTFNTKERFADHEKARTKSAIHSAIRKYGYENMALTLLHSGIDNHHELSRLEILEIINNKTLAPEGYNLTRGGDGGRHCDAVKEILRIKHTGIKQTNEHKEKIRQKNIGKKRDNNIRGKLRDIALKKYAVNSAQLQAACKSSQIKRKKRIIQINNTTGLITQWPSATDAANTTGIRQSTISMVCRNKLKQTADSRWIFI